MTSPFLRRLDLDALDAAFPSGPDFLRRYSAMSTDELRSIQEDRFASVVATAWATPFYRRLWSAHGVERGDVKSLGDLAGLPIVDKHTILDDVAAYPPFGTLGVRDDDVDVGPRVLQTTSGTTGTAQPVLWGPWGRETQNALLGRAYQWFGVGADDVVHSTYGHGLVNGGHYAREAVTRWTDALMLSAGTGSETSSERQVAAMAQFRATVLVGFADYFRRLSDVARALGIEPGVDIPVRMIVGQLPAGSRDALQEAWPGALAYDWYGVADTGIVSTEGPERDGHYVWSDAFVVELLDPEERTAIEPGTAGDMVVTSLAKSDLAPLIRFNTHDLTTELPGRGEADLPFMRTAGMQGRSDQMVKLRGINVYPTAVAAHLARIDGTLGEYVCRLERRGDGADHLVVVVEHAAPSDSVGSAIADALSSELGVKVGAEAVASGETATLTGLTTRQKPLRLIDVRA